MVVVFPQPLGPIMPRMAPRGTAMFRSKTPAPPSKSRQACAMRRTGSDEDVLGLVLIGGPLLTLRHAPRSEHASRRASRLASRSRHATTRGPTAGAVDVEAVTLHACSIASYLTRN